MSDEVDQLVGDWQRERPDLDVDSMQIWSRISRVAALFEAQRREVFRACGLEGWEFDVLAALRKAGASARLSPTELIKQTHVTSGTMTNRIERLRQRGLVSRSSDPSDGRGAAIALTAEGQRLVDQAVADLVAREEELLAGWSGSDRDALGDSLRRLRRAF